MQRTALVVVAMLVAACDAPSPSAPHPAALAPATSRANSASEATAREAAWGAGTVIFARTVEDLAFYARRSDVVKDPVNNPLFPATGHAYFNDRTARVRGHIEVDCLRVTGNTATISGKVTESNDPTIEGFEALFTVQDNDPQTKGKPADQASTVLLHAKGVGPNCAVFSEFDLVPIRGHVEVQPEVGS
jgi:hypothetical protein